MPSYVTPKRGAAFVLYVSLVSRANANVFITAPTITTGDVLVSVDGSAESNITTLPTVEPAGSKSVKVALSAAEMTGDNIRLTFSDVAGDEWCDLTINIQTTENQIDDLVLEATVELIRSTDVPAIQANIDAVAGDVTADHGTGSYVDTGAGASTADVNAARDAILTVGSTGPWTRNTEPDNAGIAIIISTGGPGPWTTGDCPTLEEIITALQPTVVVVSPVASDGQTITLNRGEAYIDAIDNAVVITVSHSSFSGSMTGDGSDVFLRLKRRYSTDASISIEGTIVSVSGTAATFSFELSSAQTGALAPGDNAYRFDVEVVLQGDSSLVVTPIADGQVNVRADIA